ncbi:MAG: Adenine deaminase [Acidimicrobiales bacterium]|nr:MAG: D-aminoacylase [Actinomycetota bacterium]MBV6507214.1 Adenine deaminase [Acidimicrobiales bacterium]RIK05500.1 MAG: aminoacylase [Acidobacteriota bacterium]
MLELLVRNGTVIDGTGEAGRRAHVGVKDGLVVDVGEPAEQAALTIDADGLIVAPGFVDLHTHYDAQLLWDPTASPSVGHGVTTVVGGNCGFALAPVRPDDRSYIARMLSRVEGMPLTSLEAGVDWQWVDFGQYLDRLEGRTAVNAGFLAGHSTIRRAVMGEDSVTEPATDDQIEAMTGLLEASLRSGALGFSTSRAKTHHDMDGHPVPSRAAEDEELVALASVVSRHEGTQLELILPGCLDGFSDEEVRLMTELSRAGNRPLNWNVLTVSSFAPDAWVGQLEASSRAAEEGASVLALMLPQGMRIRLSFLGGMVLDALPGWNEVFELAADERVRALSDPRVRARLERGAASPEAGLLGGLARWDRLVLLETFAPANRRYEGRTVGSVAQERGQAPFDALCDIVVADGLRTGLQPPMPPEGDAVWRARADVVRDRRTVVGGSDAGAHLDMMCGATYTTGMLAELVRHRQLLSWEEAIHQLTDVPARLYGLRRRGRVAEGWHADLVVFDPEAVGHGPERTLDDLPGGASRLSAEAIGVEHVFVNGVEVLRHGVATGALPGRTLHSGTDTETVTAGRAVDDQGS